MKKPKKAVIQTNTWRRVLQFMLWTLVILWTLGSIRSFSLAAKVNSTPDQGEIKPVEITENFAASEGAQTFAQNFVREYLTWNKDNYQERVDRLKPYLRQGIDEQAGLKFDNVTSNSSFEKSEIWQVSELNENESLITFKATHRIKTMIETKDAKGKVTNKEQLTGPFEKWIQVSIITDGKAFLVNGIPTFTSKPPTANIAPIEQESEQEALDLSITADIKEFLNTFYKQYSTGTIEELEYLTVDKNLRPLEGSVVYKQIDNLIILEKKDNGYLIQADAVFTDKNSNAQMLQNHEMIVSKENGRWQVIKFN